MQPLPLTRVSVDIARRALAHVWSKTERMNCERALLSFGYGRWGRIKEAAQGGTRLRSDEELERFGIAFICLCVGVPIASVGGASGRGEQESEGIAKAREVLRSVGGSVPTLTTSYNYVSLGTPRDTRWRSCAMK